MNFIETAKITIYTVSHTQNSKSQINPFPTWDILFLCNYTVVLIVLSISYLFQCCCLLGVTRQHHIYIYMYKYIYALRLDISFYRSMWRSF